MRQRDAVRLVKSCAVMVLAIWWACGCRGEADRESPLDGPSWLATPTPQPRADDTATPGNTATLSPTLTPSPTTLPTPTYPPYTDKPFSLIFRRDGDLWLSEVGGSGDRQLTDEAEGWLITSYALSPDGGTVAYTLYEGGETRDALVKQVQIASGAVEVLTGEDDLFGEDDVFWLDDTHVAFRLNEYVVGGVKGEEAGELIEQRPTVIYNTVTGEAEYHTGSLLLAQSPDGRYRLTGNREHVYEGAWDYELHDLTTEEHFPTATVAGWGSFIDWSPDGTRLLFWANEMAGTERTRLLVVDATTREEWTVTEGEYTATAGAWSPDGQEIAYGRVEDSTCSVWVVDAEGNGPRMILAGLEGWQIVLDIAWTADGARLVFSVDAGPSPSSGEMWSVRADGTDLRPIGIRDLAGDEGVEIMSSGSMSR
jgi:hypothetical protein